MKKISFEEALQQLEEIVLKLEDGELGLDESIKIYEKGMELSNICSKQLDEAERKITMLVQNNAGDFKEVSFSNEED